MLLGLSMLLLSLWLHSSHFLSINKLQVLEAILCSLLNTSIKNDSYEGLSLPSLIMGFLKEMPR